MILLKDAPGGPKLIESLSKANRRGVRSVFLVAKNIVGA